MSRAIIQSTQLAVSLSLNIQVQNEHDTRLVTLPLVQLTTLFFWLWTVRQIVTRFRFELILLVRDITDTLDLTGKVFVIGLNSLAFGFGVTP